MKVISLGWGVQSWTLAAMVALGELEPVDAALHSDTTWERQATYEFARQWTPWLKERGVSVVTVSDESAARRISDDSEQTYAPVFTLNQNGDMGQLRRSCTHRWKIVPMRRWLRSQGATRVEQWMGITVDEVERARDSDVKWIIHRFPLLDKKMTRNDCLDWLAAHDLPTPGKSSCTFCPFHTRRVFAEMKRDNDPDWQVAVQVDEAIRNKRPGYVAYVHPDRIPLIELKIAEDFGATQTSFDLFNAECDSGYCFL